MTRTAHVALVVVTLLLAGCGNSIGDDNALEVFAASSLTEAFRDLERAFEAANPDAEVSLSFAGSQVLRLQIEHGAPADVFASANPDHMSALSEAGLVIDDRTFARNRLVVIVPPENPAHIASFEDLPRAERLVIGTDNAPVGRYTREALDLSGETLGREFEPAVLDRVVSQEHNVRLVRAKVELGEADAAIVYATDAAASDRVVAVPLPPELNVEAEYPMGVVAGSPNAALASEWTAFVLSTEGQAILSRHGFVVD